MKSIISSIQNRYRRNLEEQTAALDSHVRRKLSQDVQESLQLKVASGESSKDDSFHQSTMKRIGEVKELQEIEEEIEQAREHLERMEKSESFVMKRIQSYRTKLDERKFQLKQRVQQRDRCIEADQLTKVDEEGIDELEVAMEKYRKDEEALGNIIETQKETIANIERIRRQINTMESKRDDILRSISECREFLIAAAEVDEKEALALSDDDNGEYVEGVELKDEQTEILHCDDKLQKDNRIGEDCVVQTSVENNDEIQQTNYLTYDNNKAQCKEVVRKADHFDDEPK